MNILLLTNHQFPGVPFFVVFTFIHEFTYPQNGVYHKLTWNVNHKTQIYHPLKWYYFSVIHENSASTKINGFVAILSFNHDKNAISK